MHVCVCTHVDVGSTEVNIGVFSLLLSALHFEMVFHRIQSLQNELTGWPKAVGPPCLPPPRARVTDEGNPAHLLM